MPDVVDKIASFLAHDVVGTTAVPWIAGWEGRPCIASVEVLQEAKEEIEHLRSIVGVVSRGPSFADIAKEAPRRSREDDSRDMGKNA